MAAAAVRRYSRNPLIRRRQEAFGDLQYPREEAATYMTGLPEQRARYNAWQYAAKLMLDGAGAEPLTTQIEYALMLDGRRKF